MNTKAGATVVLLDRCTGAGGCLRLLGAEHGGMHCGTRDYLTCPCLSPGILALGGRRISLAWGALHVETALENWGNAHGVIVL